MKQLKLIPKFNTEDEEQKFWDTHDLTEYFDMTTAQKVVFPNLQMSTQSISLRLPLSLLSQIKALANKQDVPYQSLMKVYLAERVREEMRP